VAYSIVYFISFSFAGAAVQRAIVLPLLPLALCIGVKLYGVGREGVWWEGEKAEVS
jgi:hypothetical protein